MADKEFLLGNRARELLKYTKQATRVVSGDISKADVRAIITRVAELDDICDVKMVCQEVVHVLDTKDKEGFTKSTFRMYGEDMRETAKKILTDIHRANNTNFVVAYEDRIHKIEEVVDGCSLLLEYITICMDEGIISVKKAGVWTKKVTDVKYMAMAWLKGDRGRANKLRSEAKEKEDRSLYNLVMSACSAAQSARKWSGFMAGASALSWGVTRIGRLLVAPLPGHRQRLLRVVRQLQRQLQQQQRIQLERHPPRSDGK